METSTKIENYIKIWFSEVGCENIHPTEAVRNNFVIMVMNIVSITQKIFYELLKEDAFPSGWMSYKNRNLRPSLLEVSC